MADVLTTSADSVLFVELNRPDKMNAMTTGMYLELADIFTHAAQDDDIRVVLWHGAGTAFSAGNDVADFLANPPAATDSPQSRLMNALVDFDKPIVAAVRGAAIGGGTTMLLHCDFVYASETTKFQLPFINLAVLPEFGSTSLLPLAIGHLRATELVLLGSSFNAQRAAELGLITQVVPDEKLLETATETARKLAAKPAGALQASKRLLKDPFRAQIKAAMNAENEAFSVAVRSDEAKEALNAFMERRPPDFSKAHKSVTAA
jgi:enoyl-CoA hydratase/carnithine racemase